MLEPAPGAYHNTVAGWGGRTRRTPQRCKVRVQHGGCGSLPPRALRPSSKRGGCRRGLTCTCPSPTRSSRATRRRGPCRSAEGVPSDRASARGASGGSAGGGAGRARVAGRVEQRCYGLRGSGDARAEGAVGLEGWSSQHRGGSCPVSGRARSQAGCSQGGMMVSMPRTSPKVRSGCSSLSVGRRSCANFM